jgi:hypothetical protein
MNVLTLLERNCASAAVRVSAQGALLDLFTRIGACEAARVGRDMMKIVSEQLRVAQGCLDEERKAQGLDG